MESREDLSITTDDIRVLHETVGGHEIEFDLEDESEGTKKTNYKADSYLVYLKNWLYHHN